MTSSGSGVGNGVRHFGFALAALCLAGLYTAALGVAAVKTGTSGPDTLVGTAQADTLRGLGSNDKLSGKGANDKLQGGSGADRLTGGPGTDTMLGDSGNDRLQAKDGTADTVNCGGGADVATVDEVDKVAANCERVEGLAADQPPAPAPTPAAASQQAPPPAGPESPPKEEGGEEETPEEEEPETDFEERPLAMFPLAHGWTNNGVGVFSNTGGPFIVNDGSAYKIETNGLGGESVTTSPALEAVDFRHSHVSFHSQVSFSNRLGQVKLRLASGNIATDYAEVTIWREDIDPIALGSTYEFQTQSISAFDVTGKVDWSAINRAQIVLTDNETGPVSLYMAGIYAVPTSKKATISFAFDDGDNTTYTIGRRKLSTYRFPATAYVIADVVGDPGWLTLEELYKLRNQHRWEIGAHSYSLAAHELPNGLDSLEPAELKVEMDNLRAWMDEQGFRRDTLAYPKGGGGQDVRLYAARDYCAGRATARGPETIPPRDNYTMRGWSINGLEDNATTVKAEVDTAVAQGSWLMLSFHDLVAGTPTEATQFNTAGFEAVVDHVRTLQKEGKVRVRTVRDALGPHCRS